MKLDRQLVASVDTNPRSAAIVHSIVALCHGLGLQVVAEGVERSAQLEFLSHCGPIAVQGFLLAQPVEAGAVPAEAVAAARRARAHRAARAQKRWCSWEADGDASPEGRTPQRNPQLLYRRAMEPSTLPRRKRVLGRCSSLKRAGG